MTIHRTRGERCVSDLLLDRWGSGELAGDEAATIETHIATCARCSERRDVVRAARATFQTELPSELARAARHIPTTKRRWQRWGTPALGALALAAGLSLFVRSRHISGGDAVVANERSKGGARISFHVKHGDRVRVGVDDDRLTPGDAVEFSYSAREGGYLTILSVDGARRASVYYADGKQAARIEPGTEVVLPQSTVLDDTLGAETVYAFFCDGAVLVEPIRMALQADPSRPPSTSGCAVDKRAFVKVSP